MVQKTSDPQKIREPAVAGLFYPGEPQNLRNMVDTLLRRVNQNSSRYHALIVPHAGYVYSGPSAAYAYAGLGKARNIKRVIILGPSHRVFVRGIAISTSNHFKTPLGLVEIDQKAQERITDLPQVVVSDEAHAMEHSLEVHLPFLQSQLDDFKIVPLVVGEASPTEVSEVIERYWDEEETLILISTDLSHYHDYETACQIDNKTCDLIKNRQYEAIGPENACGCRPLNGLLYLAKQRDINVELLDLSNSADTAGTPDRVVGYGTFGVERIH